MKTLRQLSLLKKAAALAALLSLQASATLPIWSYDSGPNSKTKMGKELIDITASIPNMPEISHKLTVKQKFRPAFGPIPWRMTQQPNSVKILFIGQDGTHIAEAAGRPATAGFGGRAQDLANYFGVDEGAAFINTYAFTIKGQYGAYNTPYVYTNSNGEKSVRFSNFVDNQLWLLTHEGPVADWRNNLIDWIIRNNKDSLKLIVTFGGAARDAIATYFQSKGAKVKARYSNQMDQIQVAETKLQYAGGNNQFPVPVNAKGQDLYQEMLGKRPNYKDQKSQNDVMKHIRDNAKDYIEKMVFTQGGPHKNGMLQAAQLNGYDLDKITFQSSITRSLKNIKLNDGSELQNDVLVVELPHPSYLSRLSKSEASKAVGDDLKVLKPYVENGWVIKADPGEKNKFAAGEDYVYARADIGPEYYDFGTPSSRMVPVSTASRMSGHAHVIVFGTRDRAKYDKQKLKQLTEAKPADSFPNDELFIARPRTKELRYIFDPGPGIEYAKLMKENLDFETIYQTKDGMSFKKNGIDAYNIKNHPSVGDFGHYRGTFQKPKLVVLADPQGFDDLITARALTGTRGQYLQGMMNDLEVEDQYLIIKTVPFAMDGATDEEWSTLLDQTRSYRKAIFDKLLSKNKDLLVVTDGKYATSEVKKLGLTNPHISIERSNNDQAHGLIQAAPLIARTLDIKDVKISGEMANIPRSHLSFYARIWEGTSGDRVLNAIDEYKGFAFAEVAPEWAWEQKTDIKAYNDDAVEALINTLLENDLLLPGEKVPAYLKRMDKKKSKKDAA